jgi:glycosyltransferase involved in cell wall biosynthesis
VRVLVVTVVHDPEDTRIAHRQIIALRSAGHEVTFAAPFTDYGRPLPSDLDSIDLPRAVGTHRFAAARAARRLVRQRRADFDIVLLHDPELVAATAGIDATGLVWDVHEDTAAAIAMKSWLPRLARPLAGLFVRRVERFAEVRLPLLLAEESYGGRFRYQHPVVPNSAVLSVDRPPMPGTDRVVYLGRLTRHRGAFELIELGRRLAPDIAVHLVGPADGDCRAQLRQAHNDGVIVWHGFVPNAEALPLLHEALAGLSLLHDQPNYAYSLPTKIVEYMANGLPVITTPNPSSADLVQKHDCGLVVPFGDVDAAEAAIWRLVDDVGLRTRMADSGRTAAEEFYSWASDAPRFVTLLEGWANESRTPGRHR